MQNLPFKILAYINVRFIKYIYTCISITRISFQKEVIGDAIMLGKLPVPGRRARPTALAAGAGGCCLYIFSLVYHFSLLSPSLSGRRPILTEILSQMAVQAKTTNQPTLV